MSNNKECIDHLDFCGGICEDCNCEVDKYGNTENQFDNCSFPDCGCDGARLCMAKNGPSERAGCQNVENMWSGKTKQQRKAVFGLIGSLQEDK